MTELFVVGENDYYQFGVGHKNHCKQLIPWSNQHKHINVNKVNQRYDGMMVTDTVSGSVWTMGRNIYGQSAINDKKYDVEKPEKIKNENIQQIFTTAVGSTTFLKIKDSIYGCGRNNEGQLGIGNNTQKIYEPTKIPNLPSTIKAMYGADKYSVALTNDGNVFSTKGGYYGGNGHGEKPKNDNHFNIIAALNQKIIMDVSVGGYHSLFLSDNGNVFAVGQNHLGQCGIGSFSDKVMDITELPLLKQKNIKIKCIASGNNHNLLIDTNGKCMSFGENGYGSLGNNTTNNSHTPQIIETLKDETTIKIQCGTYHNIVTVHRNKHYSFGSNVSNECLTNDGNSKVLKPYEIDANVHKITNKIILSVHLGYRTTSIIVCDSKTMELEREKNEKDKMEQKSEDSKNIVLSETDEKTIELIGKQMNEMTSEMVKMRKETKEERKEMRSEMVEMRKEMRSEINSLKDEIKSLKQIILSNNKNVNDTNYNYNNENTKDIYVFLKDEVHLPQYIHAFIDAGFTNFESFAYVTGDDLEKLGCKLGHRHKMLKALSKKWHK